MYFAVGWPKYYGTNDIKTGQPCVLKFNRDRSILAVLTEDTLTLWYCHVSLCSIFVLYSLEQFKKFVIRSVCENRACLTC